jgi:hypothetical protein
VFNLTSHSYKMRQDYLATQRHCNGSNKGGGGGRSGAGGGGGGGSGVGVGGGGGGVGGGNQRASLDVHMHHQLRRFLHSRSAFFRAVSNALGDINRFHIQRFFFTPGIFNHFTSLRVYSTFSLS